jgi:hypothetical protein
MASDENLDGVFIFLDLRRFAGQVKSATGWNKRSPLQKSFLTRAPSMAIIVPSPVN